MSFIWIQGGAKISITDPKPGMFPPAMLARNLGKKQRWNDHAIARYSVAEHSIHVASLVPPEHRLAALLHDAAEVVIGDIPAPVKRLLGPRIGEIEDGLLAAIGDRYGVGLVPLPDCVKRADLEMCAAEARVLMNLADAEVFEQFGTIGPKIPLMGWNAADAADEFRGRLSEWAGA